MNHFSCFLQQLKAQPVPPLLSLPGRLCPGPASAVTAKQPRAAESAPRHKSGCVTSWLACSSLLPAARCCSGQLLLRTCAGPVRYGGGVTVPFGSYNPLLETKRVWEFSRLCVTSSKAFEELGEVLGQASQPPRSTSLLACRLLSWTLLGTYVVILRNCWAGGDV